MIRMQRAGEGFSLVIQFQFCRFQWIDSANCRWNEQLNLFLNEKSIHPFFGVGHGSKDN